MSFWSGAKLRAEIPARNIVQPFDAKRIDCSAYTLTLGDEYFISPSEGDAAAEYAKKFLKAGTVTKRGANEVLEDAGKLVIPSGQFAYIITEEAVSIPPEVMGFISLKSKIKWSGLVNVSGFHVDPGFRGRLIYSVYNAGPNPIAMERGEAVFLLWLADLDELARESDSRLDKPVQMFISRELIAAAIGKVTSVENLSKKVQGLDRQLSIYKFGTWLLLTAIGTAITVIKLLD